MIYEDFEGLVDNVSKSLKTKKKAHVPPRIVVKQNEETPLDAVLPPAAGHGDGYTTPQTSANNQPYHGGPWIEGIQARLIRLMEQVHSDSDQTTKTQQAIPQGKVGMVGILGHDKGDKLPSTAADAHRQAVDPYALRGKAKREAEAEKKEANKTTVDQTNKIPEIKPVKPNETQFNQQQML